MTASGAAEGVTLDSLVPTTWFTRPGESSVWLTAYNIGNITSEQLPSQQFFFDLGDARVVVFSGTLSYPVFDFANFELAEDGTPRLETLRIQLRQLPPAPRLLVLLPYRIDGGEGNQQDAKRRTSVIVGFLAAILGQNAVLALILETVVEAASGRTSPPTVIWENPAAFPKPRLDRESVQHAQRVWARVAASDPPTRNRLHLALHWFEAALRSRFMDSFLKIWIALEVLGMPDGTNVRPLNEALASAYGFSVREAAEEFGLGRIQGARSRIVHDGVVIPIHQSLELYMQALFVDILYEMLGLSSEQRARRVAEHPGFDLRAFLLEG
jgi:hypothetical protein